MSSSTRTASQERWLRFFNVIGYNLLAPIYGSLEWLTFGAWTRWIRRSLDYVPTESTVLEVGFGPGRLQVDLAKRCKFAFGLDLAKGMCRHTTMRLIRNGLIPRLTRGSVFELPYSSNTFDAVVSTFAFSGFPHGEDALREMKRVVKDGGRIILVDIGLPTGGNRIGVFWARLWERMGDFLYDQPELMRNAGLTLVKFEEFGPGKHLRLIVGEKSANPFA